MGIRPGSARCASLVGSAYVLSNCRSCCLAGICRVPLDGPGRARLRCAGKRCRRQRAPGQSWCKDRHGARHGAAGTAAGGSTSPAGPDPRAPRLRLLDGDMALLVLRSFNQGYGAAIAALLAGHCDKLTARMHWTVDVHAADRAARGPHAGGAGGQLRPERQPPLRSRSGGAGSRSSRARRHLAFDPLAGHAGRRWRHPARHIAAGAGRCSRERGRSGHGAALAWG